MPEFPLPSFGPEIEIILAYAVDLMDLLDDKKFLWVIAAFSLVTTAILWGIKRVQNPPKLDI